MSKFFLNVEKLIEFVVWIENILNSQINMIINSIT
jgi:hypothetical protein